jgi:hypothetical protein
LLADLVESQLVGTASCAVEQAQLERVTAALVGDDRQRRFSLVSRRGHQQGGTPVRLVQRDGKIELGIQLEPRALIRFEREHHRLRLARFHRPVPPLARSQGRLGTEQGRSAEGHEHRDTQHPHHRTPSLVSLAQRRVREKFDAIALAEDG